MRFNDLCIFVYHFVLSKDQFSGKYSILFLLNFYRMYVSAQTQTCRQLNRADNFTSRNSLRDSVSFYC
jgi:hypothetical protein